MTSRNAIFYATLIGSLLPIGLWAAAELATSFVNTPLVISLLSALPDLSHSDLWICMGLMIVCSLSIPAGRTRFSLVQGLLITVTATLTIVIAVVNLANLAILGESGALVPMAAHGVEALMGSVVLAAFSVARFQERRRGATADPERVLLDVIAAACLESNSATFSRSSRTAQRAIPHVRTCAGPNRSHVSP